MFHCPELVAVRRDVTKWQRAFLLWKKPEEKLSKMADVQIQKIATGFGLFNFRHFRKEKFTFIAFNFKSKLFSIVLSSMIKYDC